MNIIDQCKKAGTIRNQQAQKVLLETSSIVDKQITPPKDNFYEVFDVVYKATEFHGKSKTPTESQLVGDLLLKLCSFMYERAHKDQDCKDISQEIIIIASKLFADIQLNEPTKQLPNTSEVTNNE